MTCTFVTSASILPSVKAGVVSFVMLSLLRLPLSDASARSMVGTDSVVSTVKVRAAESAVLPARSVTVATMVWSPSASAVLSICHCPSAAFVAATGVPPSMLTITLNASGSVLTVKPGVASWVWLSPGVPVSSLRAITGAATLVSTVTASAVEVCTFPASSVTCTVTLYVPSASSGAVKVHLPSDCTAS